MTVQEAAAALGYSPRYIYTLVDEGKLTRAAMTGKKHGAVRIVTDSIREMLQAQK